MMRIDKSPKDKNLLKIKKKLRNNKFNKRPNRTSKMINSTFHK